MASKNTSSSPNRTAESPAFQQRQCALGRRIAAAFHRGVRRLGRTVLVFYLGGRPERAAALARGTCHAGRRAWKSLRLGGCQAGTPAGRQLVRRLRHPDSGDGAARRRADHPPASAAVQPFDSLAFPHPDPRFADAGLRLLDKWSLCSSTGWGGAFGIETAALLRTHIGVLGTLILLLGCWILTGVFINRNFINKVNRAGNVMVDKSGKIVEIVKHKVVHAHGQPSDAAGDAAAIRGPPGIPGRGLPGGRPTLRPWSLP